MGKSSKDSNSGEQALYSADVVDVSDQGFYLVLRAKMRSTALKVIAFGENEQTAISKSIEDYFQEGLDQHDGFDRTIVARITKEIDRVELVGYR